MGIEGYNDNSDKIVGAKQNPDGSMDYSKAMVMIEGKRAETINALVQVKDGIEMLIGRIQNSDLSNTELEEIEKRARSIFEFDISKLFPR